MNRPALLPSLPRSHAETGLPHRGETVIYRGLDGVEQPAVVRRPVWCSRRPSLNLRLADGRYRPQSLHLLAPRGAGAPVAGWRQVDEEIP